MTRLTLNPTGKVFDKDKTVVEMEKRYDWEQAPYHVKNKGERHVYKKKETGSKNVFLTVNWHDTTKKPFIITDQMTYQQFLLKVREVYNLTKERYIDAVRNTNEAYRHQICSNSDLRELIDPGDTINFEVRSNRQECVGRLVALFFVLLTFGIMIALVWLIMSFF